MCQTDNYHKKAEAAQGHQWIVTTSKNSSIRMRPEVGPLANMSHGFVKIDGILNFEINTWSKKQFKTNKD